MTIGQPGLFPWWGTFAKAAVSDIFIHLDHVSWQKGGYLNRFLLRDGPRREWCTIPLHDAHLGSAINAVELDRPEAMTARHMARVVRLLGPCLGDEAAVNGLVSAAYGVESARAADVATTSTELVATVSGLDCAFRRSSELGPVGRSTAMLIDLVKKVGGDAYLFGPGKDGRTQRYLDVALMTRAGLRVGMAHYGSRERLSVVHDLWLGQGISPTTFPIRVEWL